MRSKGATRKGVPASKRSPKRQPASVATDPTQPLANALHERFVGEYLKDLNGAQAYARTYPKAKPDTAKANAARLLAVANVRERVEQLVRTALSSAQVNAQHVLTGLARIASLDPRKAFDAKGYLLPINEMPDDVALAIAGLEIVEITEGKGSKRRVVGYTKKIKFNDRLGAYMGLGKYFKMFLERGGEDEPPDAVPEAIDHERLNRLNQRLLKARVPVTIEG